MVDRPALVTGRRLGLLAGRASVSKWEDWVVVKDVAGYGFAVFSCSSLGWTRRLL